MNIFRVPSFRMTLTLGLALALASACALKKTVKGKGPGMNEGAQTESEDALATAAPDVNVEEAGIRGKEFQAVKELKTIHFDFDSYTLNDSARAILKDNAEYLKGHSDIEALIEGHCDQRGTNEYNLALGQKRAKETRDYLIRLGVPGKSIGTISYGKERPACGQETEECWAQNRRAESKIRSAAGTERPTPQQP